MLAVLDPFGGLPNRLDKPTRVRRLPHLGSVRGLPDLHARTLAGIVVLVAITNARNRPAPESEAQRDRRLRLEKAAASYRMGYLRDVARCT